MKTRHEIGIYTFNTHATCMYIGIYYVIPTKIIVHFSNKKGVAKKMEKATENIFTYVISN